MGGRRQPEVFYFLFFHLWRCQYAGWDFNEVLQYRDKNKANVNTYDQKQTLKIQNKINFQHFSNKLLLTLPKNLPHTISVCSPLCVSTFSNSEKTRDLIGD